MIILHAVQRKKLFQRGIARERKKRQHALPRPDANKTFFLVVYFSHARKGLSRALN